MFDRTDRQFIATAIIAPLVAWWLLVGRKKYGIKGMTQR